MTSSERSTTQSRFAQSPLLLASLRRAQGVVRDADDAVSDDAGAD
jgi:hypothetical protein